VTFNSANPELSLIERLRQLEARNPSIMIWNPLNSATGLWEATVDGHDGVICDKSPSAFIGKVVYALGQVEEMKRALKEGNEA
jgi:hypothetical protein